MLEKEIDWVHRIINDLYQGNYSSAQGKIETLKDLIPDLFKEYIKKYRGDHAKISEIKKYLKIANSALVQARHYSLRAGRKNNQETINHLKTEGMRRCKEVVEVLQELNSKF